MKRRARLGSHGLLHSVQAIDAGGLAGSCPQPGHVDVESSRDYDIQQQPAEIDIATIMGGVFLGALPCMCTHATVQLFPGRAVSRNGHIGDYVSVAVDPRPRVSTPRRPPCVPQVSELEKQASQKVAVKLATDSQTTQGDRHPGEIRPHSFVGIPAGTSGAQCSGRRYVKANPADRLAGWGDFSQNYTTGAYLSRASGVGGRRLSPVVDALTNATGTRHPSRGWVNAVSAGVPPGTLLLKMLRMPSGALLIIIKMIEI